MPSAMPTVTPKAVSFTKNTIQEGTEDQLVYGDVCEVQIKLTFDPQVLRTDSFSSDSLLGTSRLRMHAPTSCFIKLGYFNTQIMRILHEIIQQMKVEEIANVSFELDPDLLDESFKKLSKPNESKVYLDLSFDINLVRHVKERFEGLKMDGTALSCEECFKINESLIYKVNEFELAELCDFHKRDANELFRHGFVRTAFERYHKAISMLIIAQEQASFNRALSKEDKVTLPEGHEDLINRLTRTKIQLYANLSACQLKSRNFKLAKVNCTKVLELDPTNVKALFRRAQALMSMNDFELAETDLNKASELAPNDADVRKQMVMLKELEKQHAQKQKQYALNLQKMFK